jgi:hypothetical protein
MTSGPTWRPAPLARGRWHGMAAFALVLICAAPLRAQQVGLPAQLSNQEFWALTERISEPGGYFRSNSGSTDNLLSNESELSSVAGGLMAKVRPGGVYLGVGPEQNFTYIAAIKPRIAFITDIRRGNLHLHLFYKAAFELSANRAEFVGRVFSRQRSTRVTERSSAADLMDAYQSARPLDAAGFNAGFQAIKDHLTRTKALPLSKDDLEGIEYVARALHRYGPAIVYNSTNADRRTGGASSYASIMRAKDAATGTERSYLATEANFSVVKAMQTNNLIVPVVGDFAGPKALRAIGTYVRQHGAIVSAFYVSNVESYLERNGVISKFCANVASMPLDAASVFIRPSGSRVSGAFPLMRTETARC